MKEGMDDIQQLKHYALTGAEEAFASVVARHVNLVYSAALRRTGNPSVAEEITQAVFIILARKAASLPQDTVLAAWLHETVRLTVSTYQRGERHRLRREQEAAMQSLLTHETSDSWKRLAPALDDAIGNLPEKDRKAILCRFFEGKSLAEVGQILGTTEDGAHKRVVRAVEKLRVHFHRRGIVLSSVALGALLGTHAVQAAPAGIAATISATATTTAAAAATTSFTAGSVTTTAVTLSKETLQLMAWTKMQSAAGLGLAILLSATLSGLVYQDVASPAVSPTPTIATAPHVLAPRTLPQARTNSVAKLNWDQIESSDYRQYIANLRAAGFPENIIRDIILMDVHTNFQRQQSGLHKENTEVYWKRTESLSNDTFHENALSIQLYTQQQRLLYDLLGIKPHESSQFEQSLQMSPDSFDSFYAWLPEEKRIAMKNALEDNGLSTMNGYDNFDQRLAILSNILSPSELDEYTLRDSIPAIVLRNNTVYADLSPEEFKTLLSASQKTPDDSRQPSEIRQDALKLLSNAYGTERAQEILMETDPLYNRTQMAVDRYGLPSTVVQPIVQAQWQDQITAEKIAADTSISQEERDKQLAALRESGYKTIVQYLGPDAAEAVGKDLWLNGVKLR
jgi:RNA polymerase sigma factor (sigma-70 family)